MKVLIMLRLLFYLFDSLFIYENNVHVVVVSRAICGECLMRI